VSALAPFSVRSFRFQWPADLATSWAFEMEALILGWYILAATGSVQQLVALAALAWFGSLFSPFFGLLGDRIGHRELLLATRAAYAVFAAILTALTLTDALEPWHVFVIAALSGLMRPSDMMVRNLLVGQTMPTGMLMGALSLSRTTSDTARLAGAFAGAGGMALIGMGAAYAVVSAMYVAATLLSLGIAPASPAAQRRASHPLADLKEGFRYVWSMPEQLGAFAVAFLVNLFAYPFVLGLLPYVAKEVYGAGQAVLGYLAAAFWLGGLLGSLALGSGRALRAARVMLWSAGLWFTAIFFFGLTSSLPLGLALLFIAGFAQSYCMTPIAAIMLRGADASMRGRVMGVRVLAVWGLPLGLVAAGPLIARYGFTATTVLYAGVGLAATFAIGYGWRHSLWQRSAPANAR
jgi:hypothetical protein